MPHATFVLSTGRCGTQWLTEALRAALGERARVEHEPLHNDYAPRRMLGISDPAAIGGRPARRMLEHVTSIEKGLETRDYIETGHPCWGALPWLLQRFAGRVRVIHLVRHPVPTACSWLSHRAFVPPRLPMLPAKELIAPTDAGVAFTEYPEAWPTLSPYEKCLYYWAEVNALGLHLEADAHVPWLRLSYEKLFDPAAAALDQVLAFLEIPCGGPITVDRSEKVDRHHFAIESWPDLLAIQRHPRIVHLAQQLGYDVTSFDIAKLRVRFGAG